MATGEAKIQRTWQHLGRVHRGAASWMLGLFFVLVLGGGVKVKIEETFLDLPGEI